MSNLDHLKSAIGRVRAAFGLDDEDERDEDEIDTDEDTVDKEEGQDNEQDEDEDDVYAMRSSKGS